MTVTPRRVAERVTAEVEPCACDGRTLCGFHFSQLPPSEKITQRRRLGVGGHVTTFEDPRRTRDDAHDTEVRRKRRERAAVNPARYDLRDGLPNG